MTPRTNIPAGLHAMTAGELREVLAAAQEELKEAQEKLAAARAGIAQLKADLAARNAELAQERKLRELGWSAFECPACGSHLAGKMENYAAMKDRAEAAERELAAMKAENSKLRSALEIVHFKREPWQ